MKNNPFFPEIHGSFGFGCMRLPMANETVDHAAFCDMADAFIEAGFNYFDTAHGYLNGQSEIAIRECVAKRYDRQAFLLTDKLTDPYFKKKRISGLSSPANWPPAALNILIFTLCTRRTLPTIKNSAAAVPTKLPFL